MNYVYGIYELKFSVSFQSFVHSFFLHKIVGLIAASEWSLNINKLFQGFIHFSLATYVLLAKRAKQNHSEYGLESLFR